MQQHETLRQIIKLVLDRRLGKAIIDLENFLLSNPQQSDMDILMAIKNDYQLMSDYWQHGYADPQRSHVYDQLLRRLYVLAVNMTIQWKRKNCAFFHAIYARPRNIRKDWTTTAIKHDLETFVSEIALLQLTPEASRQDRSRQLYYDHQQLIHDLFDYIVTSRLWKESLATAFEDILLSPTIDTIDQQLIVSAITLANLQNFDINKFNLLVHVYQKATDEPLRQRALVGWVLSASEETVSLYPELQTVITELCADDGCQSELTEFQMQLISCSDAEDDKRRIENEIMPDILNGSRMKLTRQGLVETDDDTLEDILHPDALERRMEMVEQSMGKMMDMQKQGSDIYFGGFSQMKRFPFFNDMSNWFVPFYPNHPAICDIWQQARGKKILHAITSIGAFCDSDKYSFVCAFDQVLSRLPANMIQMVDNGEASPLPIGGEISAEEQRSPTFIRRIYLQNIYRFYKLFPARIDFKNPFDNKSSLDYATDSSTSLFFASSLFRTTALQSRYTEVASFLMKHNHFDEAISVLKDVSEPYCDYDHYVMLGTAVQHNPAITTISAFVCFGKALQLQPDSERALMGLARAAFRQQNYRVALEAYEKLYSLQPEKKSYVLNLAVCQMNVGQIDEAQKLLFKLNYLYPDDLSVIRVLAWALTLAGKFEQADKYYNRLLSVDAPHADDMLNYGYNLWFSNDVTTAIGMFRQFLAIRDDDNFSMASEFINNEYQLITSHGINDAEIQLMLDAVA